MDEYEGKLSTSILQFNRHWNHENSNDFYDVELTLNVRVWYISLRSNISVYMYMLSILTFEWCDSYMVFPFAIYY